MHVCGRYPVLFVGVVSVVVVVVMDVQSESGVLAAWGWSVER